MNIETIGRYSRQLIIPEIGLEGQMKLLSATVLVVGAGGLGSPILMYLTAAGIGNITIADFDNVEMTNLQRQILFSEADIGRQKVDVAVERLSSLNPNVTLNKIGMPISVDNAFEIINGYDVVIDATDSFFIRYVLSDVCCIKKIPLVYGSLFRLEGQVAVFNYDQNSACYRCLYPAPPPANMIPSCSEGGALGCVAGIVGSLQATECIKIILKKGEILSNKLFHMNCLDLDVSLLDIPKSSSCAVCGHAPVALNPAWYEFEGAQFVCTKIKKISPNQLATLIKNTAEKITFINVKETWEEGISYPRLNEISMPLSVIEKDPHVLVSQLSHEGKNIFYCIDGSRSEHAVSLIEKTLGYSNLYNFSGNPHQLIHSINI